MSARTLFCFGAGYTARALAGALRAEGWSVRGTCRTREKAAALGAAGIAAHIFRRDHPLADAPGALASVTHLLSSVPPDGEGDPVLATHAAAIAGCKSLVWCGYLSTTGVYGDRGGGLVDESSALAPTGDRGRRRVAAERAWQALGVDGGPAVHIFRLAGIYGPGRSALDAVRAGRARRIVKPGQVFSRIHVDDIVAVLRASMVRPNPGAVYNVCDDEPAPPQDVTEYACRLLGLAPPPEEPFETAALDAMARSFYRDNKRVSNAAIKAELGVRLSYPTYRAGLDALAARGD